MKNTWIVEDNSLNIKDLLKNESIFNVANGYIGVRGNFEEHYPKEFPSIRGAYINAFYEVVPIPYGEKAYGFPETMQKIVNVMDAQTINVIIGKERFSLFEGRIRNFRRYVNMKKGYYTREIEWISPKGKEMKIKITRLASLSRLELFAIHYEIEKMNFEDEVIIESIVNGNVQNYTDDDDPRVGGHADILTIDFVESNEGIMQIGARTRNSKQRVIGTAMHRINEAHTMTIEEEPDSLKGVYRLKEGKNPIQFTKYVIYTDSRRHNEPSKTGIELVMEESKKSFGELLQEQEQYLKRFWEVADIHIEGDEELQQGLRYNLFQLLQAVGKDSISNMPAKGLSGEGYEGHYFWDTEIYSLPFFTLCYPDLAKQLLKYRYTILDHARKRAKELGHKRGAAYAWRTITGEECSSYFPAGTAQYHINGDIAYACIQYYLATGDMEFMKAFGIEILIETGRIWLELGHFDQGLFKIDAVTGPDEYTAIVNNNYYTNVMAKYNLQWAVNLYYSLEDIDSDFSQQLCNKLNLTKEEITEFEAAYQNMYLPYDAQYKINSQDDSFLSKAVWDFENTPKEKHPLLLHYHPLTIYRHQVLKQADTVLAHFLLEDESDFETIKNSYEYYEKITTHDSSLSCAIYSIMASKIGYEKKAYDYFIETARLDLDDTHGNTKDGIHIANMGGTWMSIVYGFAGLRIKEDHISLNPRLPIQWKSLNFKFRYKGAILSVSMEKDKTIIYAKSDKPIQLKIKDQSYTLTGEKTIEV